MYSLLLQHDKKLYEVHFWFILSHLWYDIYNSMILIFFNKRKKIDLVFESFLTLIRNDR